MAKKIVIQFDDIPLSGIGFQYDILINGLNIVYTSGLNTVDVQYVDYGTIGYDPNIYIEVQPTLAGTISNTLAWMASRYSQSNVIYSIVGETIEVTINLNDLIVVNFFDSNPNITTFSFIPDDTENVNLRYFLQYKNIVNDEYLVRIFKKQFLGSPTEIHGKAIIEKGTVKDHLELIRGTGATLELEASTDLTLEDLYTENEHDLSVKIYKNNVLIFLGYVTPEGLYQSFTRDSWVITLDCVDGLGSLSNLSFVDPFGFPFKGKMKGIDIVYNCLLRTGTKMPINVSINTFYDGLTIDDSTDILAKIYMNANRFQRIDDDTIMSCEEVLKSVLDLFCSCITQEDGQWYIYKPNEIYNNSIVVFKSYNIDNLYVGLKTKKLQKSLGSQIDNFYPHHCGGNQNIQIKGSISKFRINYKYGFLSGLLTNSSLKHDGLLNYIGWSLDSVNKNYLINDPTTQLGFKMNPEIGNPTDPNDPSDKKLLATSGVIDLVAGNNFKWVIDMMYNGVALFTFKVRVGAYYLTNDITWTTDPNFFSFIPVSASAEMHSYVMEIQTPPIPEDGGAYLEIYVPKAANLTHIDATFVEIHSVDFINTFTGDNVVGEFHTAERAVKVSSNVKEVKTIYNGDNAGVIYLGVIFKEDQVTPTTLWNRKGRFESFPILRIAAEEELRISQKPQQMFKGSIYGQLPYLSVIDINNINGKFMFIEYRYDTMTNISDIKLLELFSAEITDLIYKFTFDFGNVVKPTIKG